MKKLKKRKNKKRNCKHIFEALRDSMKNSRVLNPKNVLSKLE